MHGNVCVLLDITYGVPDSTKIYIAVFASCGVLVILAFAILIARILCVFRRPLEKRYEWCYLFASIFSAIRNP